MLNIMYIHEAKTNLMKTTLLALSLLVSCSLWSQTSQPWQPDANGDGLINTEDMVQFLTVFNTSWGPDLDVPCDYQGTELEGLFGGLVNGSLQLDSMYFAYSIYDSADVYLPECPDPLTVFNLVERSGVISSFERLTYDDGRVSIVSGEEVEGHYAFFDWRYNPQFAVYSLEFGDAAIVQASAPFFDGLWHYANDHIGLPLPTEWTLDETGIHFPAYDGTMNQYGSFQFVPYWSEATD